MNKQKGITLVALVITIIILIILAGITLSLVLGNEGLIGKAKEGGDKYKNAANNELEVLSKVNEILEGNWPSGGNNPVVPVVKNGPKIKSWTVNDTTDYHVSSIKNSITEIEFVDLNEVNGPTEINNTNVWDVSEAQDGAVLAWLDGTKLYIGGKDGIKANENSSLMFYDFPNLETITFGNNYNTSEVTNMSWMFANCAKLDNLDLSKFNTSNVTKMNQMFAGYTINDVQTKTAFTALDLSSFDTSNVTSMQAMFFNCGNLVSIDLSNFDTSNVTTMADMFNMPNDNSSKLRTVIFGDGWNTAKVTATDYMFCDCVQLRTIYATKDFNAASLTKTDSMFNNTPKLVGGYGWKSGLTYRLASSTSAGAFTKIPNTTLSGQMGYVTDGLKIHYDAIRNTLEGHDNSVTIWQDLVQSGYNGTINGATWSDGYLSFDGSNDWVNMGQVNLENITMEIVLEYEDESSNTAKAPLANIEAGGYDFYVTTVNMFEVYVDGKGYKTAAAPNAYVKQKKYSLSGSYDGSVIIFWENDNKYTNPQEGTIKKPNNSTVLAIGTNPSGSSGAEQYVAMKVYSVRIYDRALTDEEIAQNHAVDKTRFGIE